MNKVIGHKEQRAELSRLFLIGSLPSTMLFEGPSGIGKALVARELAGLIFCESVGSGSQSGPGGCGNCHNCLVLKAGNLPDFHVLDCGSKDEGAVARVRELLYSLNLRSFSSPYRIVVLDNADKLSVQAANVLLKSIEEPRPNSFFVLITSNAARLPVTIRSRSQEWHFNTLPECEMREVISLNPGLLGSSSLSEWELNELLMLADGSPANLAQLSDKLTLWEEVKGIFDKVFRGDLAAGLQYTGTIGKNKEVLPQFFQLARMYARREMHEAKDALSALKWSYALSNLISAEYLVFIRNLNASYVLNAIFSDLFSDRVLDADYHLRHNEHLIEKIIV